MEIFIHHQLHPERSEGSGGIKILTILRVYLTQADVSLCSTWILSVMQRSLRRKSGIFQAISSNNTCFAPQVVSP
jgi:hypothetical protein